MSDTYETIEIESDGPVGTVRIDRIPSMNAVNTRVLQELADAVSTASAEKRAIVLTGKGEDAFIGGGDIKDFRDRSAVWFQSKFRSAMRDVEDAIESSRAPVIAAVNGIALGGGTEIALMCDLILASESATFGLPEIGLGLIPGSGGTQRLAHLIGVLKAKELIMTGKHVSAAEAEDIGLVNEVVADESFKDRVYDLASELAEGPRVAQWFAKQSINRTRADIETGLELEAALAAILFETEDAAEGLSAFIEKRDANFGNDL